MNYSLQKVVRSSCPPADAYLSTFEDEPESRDTQVIPLAYHVDYWDYSVGDKFASKAFLVKSNVCITLRQAGLYTGFCC
ncbi:DUF1223 domain-containing protein [Vibrio chagasii]|nr:DUF1223 domain-containing protein [Vibrio chagasii]